MSTKAEREALCEQWYEELLVERNETFKAHAALIKNSSSVPGSARRYQITPGDAG